MAAVCVLWVGNCRLCCEMGWRKAKSLERTRLSVVHGTSQVPVCTGGSSATRATFWYGHTSLRYARIPYRYGSQDLL
jgi:hypothetical protein